MPLRMRLSPRHESFPQCYETEIFQQPETDIEPRGENPSSSRSPPVQVPHTHWSKDIQYSGLKRTESLEWMTLGCGLERKQKNPFRIRSVTMQIVVRRKTVVIARFEEIRDLHSPSLRNSTWNTRDWFGRERRDGGDLGRKKNRRPTSLFSCGVISVLGKCI